MGTLDRDMVSEYAPGKAILLGEHAVVYHRPAIAVPVTQVQAQATIEPSKPGTGVLISAPDIDWSGRLSETAADNPLCVIVASTLSRLHVGPCPDIAIRVTSTIPMACGMGSGTALSVAIVRALSRYFGVSLSNEIISALTFEVEKIYHGTPSGIDNTVVTYQTPVYFVKGESPEPVEVGTTFQLVIGDTGICSPTHIAVGDVRQNWQRAPHKYEQIFDQIGEIVQTARRVIETGRPAALGPLMNANQELLQQIDVSCPELETLIDAARRAGASGAKLSGAGRGGNMIALVTDETKSSVEQALVSHGATRVISTEVVRRVGVGQ